MEETNRVVFFYEFYRNQGRIKAVFLDAHGATQAVRVYHETRESFKLNDDILNWVRDGRLPK